MKTTTITAMAHAKAFAALAAKAASSKTATFGGMDVDPVYYAGMLYQSALNAYDVAEYTKKSV